MDSIFEVKNITKEGFELYNLVNEKEYSVKSQIKMINYRRVFKGNYLLCKIVLVGEEYFLSNIQRIIKQSDCINVYKEAVARQMENPSLLYEDNEDKLKEIKETVVTIGEKYKEFFKTEEVHTSGEKFNELLNLFNEYIDNGEKADYEKYTETPDTADIIVKYDKEYGLLTIPKNKQNEPEKKEFSVTTILYSSKAFEKVMELSEEANSDKANKIGRNDPCACGSGKKYKKCCMGN